MYPHKSVCKSCVFAQQADGLPDSFRDLCAGGAHLHRPGVQILRPAAHSFQPTVQRWLSGKHSTGDKWGSCPLTNLQT